MNPRKEEEGRRCRLVQRRDCRRDDASLRLRLLSARENKRVTSRWACCVDREVLHLLLLTVEKVRERGWTVEMARRRRGSARACCRPLQ